MLNTYKAKLNGNHLEWSDEVPLEIRSGEMDVLVTVLERNGSHLAGKAERGKRMVAALERLAAMGGVPSIPDPVAWQREMREDRPLPGREE